MGGGEGGCRGGAVCLGFFFFYNHMLFNNKVVEIRTACDEP